MKNKTKLTIVGITVLSLNLALAERGERGEKGERGGRDRAEIFAKLDADESGSLTYEELASSKRFDENEEKAEKVFAHIDANGDGEITVEEFTSAKRPKKGGKKGNEDSE